MLCELLWPCSLHSFLILGICPRDVDPLNFHTVIENPVFHWGAFSNKGSPAFLQIYTHAG